jgi:integrase
LRGREHYPNAFRSHADSSARACILKQQRSRRAVSESSSILFPNRKVAKKKPQPIASADFEKLLQQAPDLRSPADLRCGWWGGLRLSEALQLRCQRTSDQLWVHFEDNESVLPAEFVKSGGDQWIPLHLVLNAALEEFPRTGGERLFPFRSAKTKNYLSRSGVTNRIMLMAKRAGVKLSMHRLRRGFGCRVAKQLGKGNAPVLHRLMRHSSMQITMDYYASVDNALHDIVNQLD